MSKYNSNSMLKNSRYIDLSKKVDNDFLVQWKEKIDKLVLENKDYCTKKNYEYLCNLFSSLAYLMLMEEKGEDRTQIVEFLEKETFEFLIPAKKKYQKLLKKHWAFRFIKKFVPNKMASLTGHGWTIEGGNSSKDSFTFYTRKCLIHEILSKYHYKELGPLFCHVDIYLYTDIENTRFYRKETLNEGGKECDFTFKWEK